MASCTTTSTYSPSIVFPILLLLPCLTILGIHLCTAQSPPGFVSIDCGASQTANYTDALGIEWAPDATIWPDIGSWSFTSDITPPGNNTSGGGVRYQTLRYFPPSSKSTLNQTKFCYTLPATGDGYYLVRATFWYGTSNKMLYSTRVPGVISFRVVVDTYTGAKINITLPQTSPQTEEMYVRAQSGSSSVSVCFSAASDNSDSPFVNALELRPLSSTMTSVSMINNTNTALRTAARLDFGASPTGLSIIRYPDDSLDRLWVTATTEPSIQTSFPVTIEGIDELPPVSVVQTSYVAPSNAGFSYIQTDNLAGTSYRCYLELYFAELDSRVNASGLRVFDIAINGDSYFTGLDVYDKVGPNRAFGLYSPKPQGPYSDHLLINVTSTPSSVYPPFIAAAEILQLFDNPMVPSTSSVDILGVQGIATALSNNLSRFTGDPCLPADYKYPWLTCSTDNGIDLPPRVTSISLSNFMLVGNVPSSINNLDQAVQILLDGNALEGPLPVDLSNLVNLQVLNLSSNKLSGPIPDSLANLPKLMYLDLQNNNFSGEIPISLQKKTGLTFKYDGNSFLCLSSNETCAASTTTSSTRNSSLPTIIGSVVVVIGLCIVIFIVSICIFCKRRRRRHHQNEASAIPTSPHELLGPQVVSQTKIFEAANVSHAFSFQEIVTATQNFSTIIGKGGFGFVYKGTLANGVPVAVKVLSDASQQGAHEFLNEVTLLCRVHHKNLVGLVGYCTQKKLVLVYEFMSNGSLFDSLFGKKNMLMVRSLQWTERLRILLDAAQGLAYLHHGCNSLIIHRDVKSSNILMTKDLEGKMSDFGISRLKSSTSAHDELATKLIGSFGYVDPEFASTLILSEKIDIYSFGVVLFEVVCGKPPVIKDLELYSDNDIHIVEWVRPYYNHGAMEEIVDRDMGHYNISSIWKVAEIAMACVQFEGRTRPTMNEVCHELSEALRLETTQTISSPITEEYNPLNDVGAR